jgi:hypothetical protein
MVLGDALALLAGDTIRVKVLPEPFEARGVVREGLVEVFEGVALHTGLLGWRRTTYRVYLR